MRREGLFEITEVCIRQAHVAQMRADRFLSLHVFGCAQSGLQPLHSFLGMKTEIKNVQAGIHVLIAQFVCKLVGRAVFNSVIVTGNYIIPLHVEIGQRALHGVTAVKIEMVDIEKNRSIMNSVPQSGFL